jgi:hypothetical protein
MEDSQTSLEELADLTAVATGGFLNIMDNLASVSRSSWGAVETPTERTHLLRVISDATSGGAGEPGSLGIAFAASSRFSAQDRVRARPLWGDTKGNVNTPYLFTSFGRRIGFRQFERLSAYLPLLSSFEQCVWQSNGTYKREDCGGTVDQWES